MKTQKSLQEMNYEEMIDELKRVRGLLAKENISLFQKKDLEKYKFKLLKEIKDYQKFRRKYNEQKKANLA